MRRLVVSLCALIPSLVSAGNLVVDVRDARGAATSNAVVYAVPEGKKSTPSKETVIMDQKNRMFVPHVLPVQTGTSVRFPNSDDISHQVYSFSSAKSFQLPLYKGTPANPVVFDKPGIVTLGCNIHDRMTAYIVVVETPYFALTETDGRVDLATVAEGKYVVYVWHPKLGESSPTSVTVGDGGRQTLSVVIGR